MSIDFTKRNLVNEEDMALRNDLPIYVSPEKIPLSFRLGSRIIRGIPESFNPQVERKHIDTTMYQTIVTGRNRSGLEIRAEYIQYNDYPMVEWVAYITNKGKSNTAQISDLKILTDVEMPAERPLLERNNGDNCTYESYKGETFRLLKKVKLMPKDGKSCSGEFPYMKILGKDRGYNIAIGWPGTWMAEFAPSKGGFKMSAGIGILDSYLKPGETFRTPRVNIMAYKGDRDRGVNMWRRFYMKHIIPHENGHPIPPLFIINDPGPGIEWTESTEKNQLDGIKRFIERDLKPDLWWIDAGWYSCIDKNSGKPNWVLTGTWEPDKKRYPRGLRPIGELCEKEKIRFLLWFEPERFAEGSAFDTMHPEYVLKLREESGNYSWTRSIDFSNPDCVKWLTDFISDKIDEYKLSVYRQDANIHPQDIFLSQHDEENRKGSTENLYFQGMLRFHDELLARHPGLWIDNCSSGGRRNDLETMRRSIPLHYTDVGYGMHVVKQMHNKAMYSWIPYFRSLAYSWDDENGEYHGDFSPFVPFKHDDFAYYNAMTPAIGCWKWGSEADEDIMSCIRKMRKIWEPAAQIMIDGDYYQLIDSHEKTDEYCAVQFDDPELKKGFVEVIRNVKVEEDSVTVRPVVDKNATYTFHCMDPEQDFTISGKKLAQKGFEVCIPKRSGIMWYYTYS